MPQSPRAGPVPLPSLTRNRCPDCALSKTLAIDQEHALSFLFSFSLLKLVYSSLSLSFVLIIMVSTAIGHSPEKILPHIQKKKSLIFNAIGSTKRKSLLLFVGVSSYVLVSPPFIPLYKCDKVIDRLVEKIG